MTQPDEIPDEILDANLRALLTRAYAPVRPSREFRARLERELELRPRRRFLPLAAAALLLCVVGAALRFSLGDGGAQAPSSRLRQDGQAWRPLTESESARGVEYAQGTLELELAPGRLAERVWVGAHGALQLEGGAQVEIRGGPAAPHIALGAGRARAERVESGGDWTLAAAGVEFALGSGALRLEHKPGELLALLESGAGTYGAAREPLPARRELCFRNGALVGAAASLEQPVAGVTRRAFPVGDVEPEPAAPATGEPSLAFRGRLTGPDGAPWSGAFTLVALREERLPEVSRGIARSFRDAQGRFEFPLARGGRYTLFALAPGTAALRRGGLEPSREPRELELRLETGLVLRGRVLDSATGAPLAGASVVSEDDAPAQILAFDPAQLPAELAARATTDAEGRFVLERLSSGLHTLRACAAGHGAAWSPRVDARTASGEIELRLGSGGAIEAQLEPPAERVPLVASAVDYGFQRPCLSYALGFTDALGRARFEHLPPGPFVVLRVDAQASTDASFAFVREGGSTEVRLGAAAVGHALAGSLSDASGAPLPGADLMLEASDPTDEQWRSTRTDASGRFRFDGVRPGEYVLYAGDLGRNFIEVDRVRVGALDVARALVLPAGEIAGRVRVASSAAALPLAWLIAQREVDGAWRFAGKTQADEQGAFRFRNVAPGTWRVIAHATGERLAPAASPALLVRASGEPLEVELALAPGAALELVVREPGGEPCAGASIELRDAAGELWQFSPADRSDSAGRFLVQGMPPGEWTVKVVKNGRADAVRKFQLEVDQQATLEIQLQPR